MRFWWFSTQIGRHQAKSKDPKPDPTASPKKSFFCRLIKKSQMQVDLCEILKDDGADRSFVSNFGF
jgi:hypothetical protein